jgi:hypothetical protein
LAEVTGLREGWHTKELWKSVEKVKAEGDQQSTVEMKLRHLKNLDRKIKSPVFRGVRNATRNSYLHYRAAAGQFPFRHSFPFSGSESRTIPLTVANRLKLCNQIKSQEELVIRVQPSVAETNRARRSEEISTFS